MCILSGCDFLKGLPGIGLKKAHAAIRKHKGFVRAVRFMRFQGASVPKDYEASFQRALWAFRHQRVYCAERGCLVHLNDLPPGGIAGGDVEVVAALPEDEGERQVGTHAPHRTLLCFQRAAAWHLDCTSALLNICAIYAFIYVI